MQKNERRLLIFMIEMAIFSAIMIFSIVNRFQHPQILFWGILVAFAAIIAIEIAPTLKDTVILVIGMIILAIAGTVVDKFVSYFFGSDTLIGFIVTCIALAPFYFPLAGHFVNLCKKRVRLMKKEDLESKCK